MGGESSASTYYDIQQNDGLPEKCCVDKFNGGELTEADVQDRVESTTGDDSKAPSPSKSPIQDPSNTIEWTYVTNLTPNPTAVSEISVIQATPNPTPGEDSIGWRPSIIPSWIPPAEKELPVVTPIPSRQPTPNPSRQPTRKVSTSPLDTLL